MRLDTHRLQLKPALLKVHGNEELNAILNADGQKDDDNTLPRLSLAIEYKEKKVQS